MEAPVPVDYVSLTHPENTRSHSAMPMTARAMSVERRRGRHRSARHGPACLVSQLQLVTIELTAEEDSQEIFETPTPAESAGTAARTLSATMSFRCLRCRGADTEKVYYPGWPFESKSGEGDQPRRRKVSRSSLFLNQWLVSRIGEDQSALTSSRFKSYVKHSGPAMTACPISSSGDLYERCPLPTQKNRLGTGSVEMSCTEIKIVDELLDAAVVGSTSPARTTWPSSPGSSGMVSWLVPPSASPSLELRSRSRNVAQTSSEPARVQNRRTFPGSDPAQPCAC